MLTPMPNADSIEFKQEFIERYSQLTDFEEFRRVSLSFPRKAFRINTLKADVRDVLEGFKREWDIKQVPWCAEGFFVESERRDIGNTLEHSLGLIYVQDAASMIPAVVLNPSPGEVVLDMCAAPGSKSTQIAQYMKNQGLLISNDSDYKRIKALAMNLQRCGVANAVITLTDAQKYSFMKNFFDKILLDAPCSGTGTINKSVETIKMWNPSMVKRLSSIQKRLINAAFSALKPGGTLVYSTCTMEPEENESVVNFLLSKHEDANLEEISLNIKRSRPIMEFEGERFREEISKCLRIWPQDNLTEGFFVAKILKG
ncbi:MAG: RsmB/NOP family class I SAM-dependent RNA methyltransferase [Candidatus Woesearchaeota archaeon]